MGKPLAGQLGQQIAPGNNRDFYNQQQSRMPQQNLGGFGGGYGGGFQPQFGGGFGVIQPQFGGGYGGGFQPQFDGGYQPSRQRFNQMPQQGFGGFQPQFDGGFRNRQMPQQPQQNFGGFGGIQQAFQAFMRQQQMGQQYQNSRPDLTGGPMGAPQQSMIGPGGGSRDFYDRQVQPQQEFGPSQAAAQAATLQSMGSGFGQNSRPDLTGGPMGAPQQPQSQMPQSQMNPMQQAIQGGIRNGQFSPRALSRADMMGRLGEMPTVNSGAPAPQAPAAMLGAPQTDPRFKDGGAVTEDPRMQAMRGIQQLANRQRGFR